ncbi:hypothetical protein ISCGN_008780 [Ixodes scapularis]
MKMENVEFRPLRSIKDLCTSHSRTTARSGLGSHVKKLQNAGGWEQRRRIVGRPRVIRLVMASGQGDGAGLVFGLLLRIIASTRRDVRIIAAPMFNIGDEHGSHLNHSVRVMLSAA